MLIMPMSIERVREKISSSSFIITASCLLYKLGLALCICFLIRHFVCFSISGKKSADIEEESCAMKFIENRKKQKKKKRILGTEQVPVTATKSRLCLLAGTSGATRPKTK